MADAKLSVLTELSAEPADTDEFYINDGGVSKRITYATLKAELQEIVNDTSPQLGGHLAGGGFDITGLGTLSMTEQAAANADVAGDGQIWVKTAAPNELWYTDDAGTDHQVFTADNVVPLSGLLKRSVTAGITADVGSAQGGSPLTTDINEISTCANAGDAVTLPTAVAGYEVTIINNGAEACDVFPASGDDLGAGADTAASLAAAANITYIAIDASTWVAKT